MLLTEPSLLLPLLSFPFLPFLAFLFLLWLLILFVAVLLPQACVILPLALILIFQLRQLLWQLLLLISFTQQQLIFLLQFVAPLRFVSTLILPVLFESFPILIEVFLVLVLVQAPFLFLPLLFLTVPLLLIVLIFIFRLQRLFPLRFFSVLRVIVLLRPTSLLILFIVSVVLPPRLISFLSRPFLALLSV